MLLITALCVICLNNVILADLTLSCNEPSIFDNIRKTVEVNFTITTSAHSREYFIQNTKFDLPDYSDYATNNKTYILVHGFSSSYEDSWIPWLKGKLLGMRSTNVITLNYAVKPSSYKNYAFSTSYIALRTFEFLKEIAKTLKKPVKQLGYIHIIGHSLGSHIAGQVAGKLKAENNFVVDRVTGLDPAEPCFKDDATGRLNSSNAKLVDVIHTDSVPSGDHLGIHAAAGHLDFYPDDGSNQPACQPQNGRWFGESFVNAIVNKVSRVWTGEHSAHLVRNLLFQRNDLLCNHYKAPEYFILSTIYSKSCKFWAIPESEKQNLKKNDFNINDFCQKKNVCVEMGMSAGSYNKKKWIGKYYINITSTFERCNIQKKNYIKVKLIE